MWFLSNISLRWAVALIVPVLFVLFAGTWLTAKRLTDDLLKKDATEDARAWAEFLATNVPDLEQIAAGEQPSSTSLSFFEATNKTGRVIRYVIYNREGYSQLVFDHSLKDSATGLGRDWKPLPPGYPPFQPILYSADVLLPIVNLQQKDYWAPNSERPRGYWARLYLPLHILAGWFFTTLFVVGVTGLIRRE